LLILFRELDKSILPAQRPVSFCPSVSKSEFYQNDGQIELMFWHGIDGDFVRPILHYVIMKFRYLQKQGHFPREISPKLWTWKFSPQHTIVVTWYQFSSTMVDACSMINWTVIGQQYKLTMPATLDE